MPGVRSFAMFTGLHVISFDFRSLRHPQVTAQHAAQEGSWESPHLREVTFRVPEIPIHL